MAGNKKNPGKRVLRSQYWFSNPEDPGMTALYFERYLNFGFTKAEITSGRPIIGIAIEFPMHPIHQTGKRPTAALDRNLAYLSLVEVLYGYPLDGVVLTTGC